MRRLRNNSSLNSPEEYYKLFIGRRSKPDPMDMKRWQALISAYRGGPLIDLGCLDSMVPFIAKSKYPDEPIWALDQAKDVIDFLAKTYPEINYITGDIYKTPFSDEYFSYVVAGELIEHLERPADFFKEAFRILKPGGKLALTTPKEETEAGEVDQFRHLWSFSASDIRDLAKPYMKGAKIKEIPSWLERRIKYHHPYLLCLITKK